MSRNLLVSLLWALVGTAFAQPLTVMTHDSFDLPADLLDRFEEETGVEVAILPAGDAGQALNRAILTKHAPLADLFFGVDNSLLTRAVEEELFIPYQSPRLEDVPAELRLDPEHRVTPVDVGYIVFNLDVNWFEERGVPLPDDLDDLLEPEYAGLTVVSDPASSSPGLGFMLATIARYGEDGWLDFWAGLRDNDLLVTSSWSDAYYTAFTRYGGDRPIVLSYATSPAAEVIFAEEPLTEAPTANLLCDTCAWRQIEAIGVLSGSELIPEAQLFIDFLLSPEVQEAIPTSMFVYPVVERVPLPDEFLEHADVPAPEQVASLPPDVIASGLERWLDSWTRVVVQGAEPEQAR